MTDKPLSAVAGPSTAAPSLAYMAPAWFAVVMGWSGLAGAWLRAEFLLGDQARALGTLGAVLAALAFVALGLASLRRLSAHPAAVRADMLHPVRHAFMATLPISMLLLAGLGVQLAWRVDPWLDKAWALLWIVGSVLELAATVWVIGRWLQPKEQNDRYLIQNSKGQRKRKGGRGELLLPLMLISTLRITSAAPWLVQT